MLIDDEPVAACMTAVAQVADRRVTTIEGLLDSDPVVSSLRAAFHAHGAAQCGMCTPAALAAAVALLRANPAPSESEIADGLGGVLCRCTGYRAILDAVAEAASPHGEERSDEAIQGRTAEQRLLGRFAALAMTAGAVGARLPRLDGSRKLDGSEIFGADAWPADALRAQVIRSPHDHATFAFGDLAAWAARHPGVVAVFTAKDVPGVNRFGAIPAFADQPALAENRALFRGDAVALVVGEDEAMAALDLGDFPVIFTPLPALKTIDEALSPGRAAPPCASPRQRARRRPGRARRRRSGSGEQRRRRRRNF